MEDTPGAETPPTKASVNLTIGEDWGYNTNYGGLMFYQVTLGQSRGHIKPTWVLLENQSTMDVFSNRRPLKNIRKLDRLLAIFSMGGRKTTNLQGDLPRYGTVWYHPGVIANILYLSKEENKYRVSYDSTGENKFIVHLPGGGIRSFTQCKRGLLYSNMAAGETVLRQYCRI